MPERANLPVLRLAFPRELNTVHQLEITSRCNLRCTYCPSPHLGRPKVDMTQAVFTRALEWVHHYVIKGTQHVLNLAGIGESTLHPLFPEFVAQAREVMGPDRELIFATNGLLCDDLLIAKLRPSKPAVWVSLHRPEKASIAAARYKAAGLLVGVSAHPSLDPMDWAGQIKNKWSEELGAGVKRQAAAPCPWIRHGMAMVMADGRLTTCCYDSTGIGVVGHVDDKIGSVGVAPYALCNDCDQELGVHGVTQRFHEMRS